MMKLSNKLLTSKEAAKLLGFTPDHVRRLILQGKIKAEKLGHNYLIAPHAIKNIKRRRKLNHGSCSPE